MINGITTPAEDVASKTQLPRPHSVDEQKNPGKFQGRFGTDLVPVFNQQDFLDRVMRDVDLARRVAEGFRSELPGQLATLRAAALAGSGTQAGKVAHRLRGAAGAVGGQALQRAAAELEQRGTGVNEGELQRMVNRVETEAAALCAALDAFLQDANFNS